MDRELLVFADRPYYLLKLNRFLVVQMQNLPDDGCGKPHYAYHCSRERRFDTFEELIDGVLGGSVRRGHSSAER
jgi:hypothetical protein